MQNQQIFSAASIGLYHVEIMSISPQEAKYGPELTTNNTSLPHFPFVAALYRISRTFFYRFEIL